MIPGIVASVRRGGQMVFPLTLINPDAETNTGSTTTAAPIGWTVTQGNLRVRVNEAGREPPQGLSIFDGGTSPSSRAFQRVDLVAQGVPAQLLDAGALRLEARWWAGSFISNPLDIPQLSFICRDGALSPLGTLTRGPYTPLNVIGSMVWDELLDVFPLPAGTRYIDVEMYAARNSGTNNDAAFDDIRIRLLRVPSDGDPYFDFVLSLLHFDGENGSTSFIDQKALTWTAAGNAQLSTALKKFGSASLRCDGTGDYITSTAASLNLSSSIYTIEGWAYLDATNYSPSASQNGRTIFSTFNVQGAGRIFINMTATGALQFNEQSPNGTTNHQVESAAAAVPQRQWFHWAATRDDIGTTGRIRLFINGVLVASATGRAARTDMQARVYLGCLDPGSGSFANWWLGNIDDVRITKGVARYVTDFTPPTAAFPDH